MKEFQGKLICHSSITRSLDLCILKLKKHDFVSLIFFQEVGIRSLFLCFQKCFSVSYFPISLEPFDQNSSLTLLWINDLKLKIFRE